MTLKKIARPSADRRKETTWYVTFIESSASGPLFSRALRAGTLT